MEHILKNKDNQYIYRETNNDFIEIIKKHYGSLETPIETTELILKYQSRFGINIFNGIYTSNVNMESFIYLQSKIAT